MERLDETTIKVVLTTADMKELSLSYKDLDYNKAETKKAISQIVSRINSELKINLTTQKLFIEAYPYADGGCILFVNQIIGNTQSSQSTKKHKASGEAPVLYRFKDIDSLGRLAKKLKAEFSGVIAKNSLYHSKTKSEYYLAIYARTKQNINLKRTLDEYGTFLGKGAIAIAIIKEHNDELIKTNAIHVLSSCL